MRKFFKEVLGLFLLFWALLLFLSLFTFDANDPSFNLVKSGVPEIQNKGGLFGAYAAGFLNDFFGVGALFWPVLFAALGAGYVFAGYTIRWWRWCGFLLLAICLLVISSALDFSIGDLSGGGWIGTSLYKNSQHYFSPIGSFLLWFFVVLIGLQLACNFSWINLASRLSAWFKANMTRENAPNISKNLLERASSMRENIKNGAASLSPGKLASGFANACKKIKISKIIVLPKFKKSPQQEAGLDIGPMPDLASDSASDNTPAPAAEPVSDNSVQAVNMVEPAQVTPEVTEEVIQPIHETTLPEPEQKQDKVLQVSAEEIQITKIPEPEVQKTGTSSSVSPVPVKAVQEEAKAVPLPSTSLLVPPAPGVDVPIDMLKEKGQALMSCLKDFSIVGELVRITPGPVVTMYEVRPAPGIRVSKITNLSDDISRALMAPTVRIQAPIPGSDTVGVEIPNETRQTVNFRELVETEQFRNGVGPLTMILGKDIAGRPYMADLTRMPHLLIAGATGAGKSVCLNAILVSLLYRVQPSQMRLLLVDPKRMEMAAYADLPHLVHPVVTEMDDAKTALDWAVHEMQNRNRIIPQLGVRNVADYNRKLASFGGNLPPQLASLKPLPYIVIVIDELADLMMTAPREVETSIVRLAQLARAAGIHMILATQRPSVDVVTGLIKANFLCRISFQVTSKHDSRTILDQMGAEHLLGRGDMLFKPSGARLMRLHGPFLSDEEVQKVVDHWKSYLRPQYEIDFSQWAPPGSQTTSIGGDASTDSYYDEAKDFVLEQGRASISLLQRHFKIGFNRAARLMEQFERDGIIGPADGSKPRNVLR